MAVTYTTALKNTRMDAVTTAIDAGAGAGKLEIGTSGMAITITTITLSDPCATAAAAGVLTFAGFPKNGTSVATGVMAAARFRTSTNADVITGLTVGTTGTDIIFTGSATVAATGQTITINSAAITHG